jgi:ADP-dependent NAD(P)H-hydrate dehydratase
LKRVTPKFLFGNPLPDHKADGDKQERGRVLIVAGSVEIPGAALLASLGAMRAGAGILQIATCQTSASQLGIAMPEAMVVGCRETARGGIDPSVVPRLVELASECDAVLLGPGMTDGEAVAALALALLTEVRGPVFVLDASAFTSMREQSDILQRNGGRVVGTPHSGEMAKFLDITREAVEADPITAAHKAAAVVGGVVALKGKATHIVDPSGQSWLCEHGCIGLATSGSGDTLAGILAGLLARGAAPSLAAVWSVYLHAEAGQRLAARTGTVGFLAREIPREIPRIMEDISKGIRRLDEVE